MEELHRLCDSVLHSPAAGIVTHYKFHRAASRGDDEGWLLVAVAAYDDWRVPLVSRSVTRESLTWG